MPKLQELAPTFTQYSKLEDALPFIFINKEGIEAEKRILWVLNQQYKIEYSPLIPIIASLLLIFLHEEEAYCVMRVLVERSSKTQSSHEIRWHFTLTKADFGR